MRLCADPLLWNLSVYLASYKDGFDPLADEYRNYSYGTRIWQISCSILRDTIWVVIPRYQAPFIMS